VGYEFHALSFAAAKGGAGLAEFEIPKTSLAKRLERAFDSGETREEVDCFID
jgi:hypothetical protein